MSEEWSARLALPLLQAGQAQKETDHNEALALLDIAVQATVQSVGMTSPPASPGEGQCWIVGPAPTGGWSGHGGAIAGWTAGGWRFVAPRDGMSAWSADDATTAVYRDGAWSVGLIRGDAVVIGDETVVTGRQPAIADPSGGTAADAEARAAIADILSALRTHGLIAT